MNPTQGRPGNGAPQGAPMHHFVETVDHLGESAQKLAAEARTAVREFVGAVDLRGRVNRHPYGMIAAAMGVGYVLGGGLFTSLTSRILRLGVRLAALPFVKNELVGLAEAVSKNLTGRTEAGEQERAATTEASEGSGGGQTSG